MFLDDAVIAGLLAVGATLVFLGGVAYFIYKEYQKQPPKKKH